ncbi:mitogen-activated protein kinase kinase kinase 7-like isoform X2 [Watersipora subatra]|uniref:mitogen-activated protein kinase kinase kinase 7-like isoform X2 n=1 Tax=Watersipora subatra TaxID=2589382 RepID=UPI00355B403C
MAVASQKSTFGFVEEIDYNELKFGQVVGRGAFGTVHKAWWRGRDVAVKQIETENEKRAFVQELKQLSRVSHENIVKLYGASTKYPVFLVMELAECGSLYHLLHVTKPLIDYSAAHAVCWSLQTALGVSYLHNMKPKPIIHRDLKPPNLLLVKKGTVIKLCDFGTAADMKTHMTNNKGSAAWMAPEVFEGNRYSEKCDVFSWGIVLWECLSRKKPFEEVGGSTYRIMWAVHEGKRPALLRGTPAPLEKLMTKCWSKIPADRPSMDEVVRIMLEIIPFYKEKLTPLAFPGSDEESADEEKRSLSNESESLQIEDILHTGSIDMSDKSGTNLSRAVSRPTSHRGTEEAEKPSLRSLSSISSATAKGDQTSLVGAQGARTPAIDVYSPRNLAKGQNIQKRYSAEGEQLRPLLEHMSMDETPQPAPRKKTLGHRRVGSHGNPPIKLDPPPVQPTPPFPRMTTSASHPGHHLSEPKDHVGLVHSRSWTPDNPGAGQPYTHGQSSTEPQSTPTPPPSFPQIDDSLKPLQPLPSSNQSLLIYYEHVALAERYVAVQQEGTVIRSKIAEIKNKLAEQKAIREKNLQLMKDFQRLADENEDYMNTKEMLERQAHRVIS